MRPDRMTGRAVVTSNGTYDEYVPEDLPGMSQDPIFGVDGDLAFNWWFHGGRAAARIAIDGGNLTCEDCVWRTPGLGGELAAEVRAGRGSPEFWHDAALVGDDSCFGSHCRAQGADRGSGLRPGQVLGQYAIFVATELRPFRCGKGHIATR